MTSLYLATTALECAVINPRQTLPIPPEPHSDPGCQAVAMCLSQKLHGRFRSFLAGKLIWISRHYKHKSITIRSISELLECFSITMATLLGFFKI